MTVLAQPRMPGLAARAGLRAVSAVSAAARRVLSPHKAALANLASIPLTVAGTACIDAAAFAGNLIAGLVVTGVSLILLEHIIADEQ